MLKNAYLLAKIGADTAENEQHLPKFCQPTLLSPVELGGGAVAMVPVSTVGLVQGPPPATWAVYLDIQAIAAGLKLVELLYI